MLVMNDDGPVGGVWLEGGCVLLLLIAQRSSDML